ncbi:hypothetical protein BGY98DRAFT_1100259 [Russula aff. rugulosa BPL654]|nr:hypothetical protein BGY98DRAFT_1100259 [Russula aff. rugulosa BPL654]
MLYKPLVALFMAFAATGGVAASTTPVRRGAVGHYPPPPGPTMPAKNCNSNTELYCCNTLTTTSNPIVAGVLGLLGVGSVSTALAALDCESLGVLSPTSTCSHNSVCCTDTYQEGLVNFGCTQVIL